MHRTMITGLRATAIALAGLGAGAPAAHAQSGYVLTTLKPGASAVPLDARFQPWAIDQTERVLGNTVYLEGYYWSLVTLSFQPRYTQYVARWPMSVLSTVAPAKAVTATNLMGAASPNGQLVTLVNTPPGLYDTAGKKLVGTFFSSTASPGSLAVLAVNNAGTVLADRPTSYDVPLTPGAPGGVSFLLPHAWTWTATQGLAALPEGGGLMSAAWGLNGSGVVAGMVTTGDRNLSQAVLWRGGQLEPIPQAPDTVSAAFRVNDAGQVLLRRAPIGACNVGLDPRSICQTLPDTVYLRDNGVETPLLPADGGRWIAHAVLSNTGVVVGRYRTGAPASRMPLEADRDDSLADEDGRAFIWQKGVFTDLSTWVASKGLSLPAGSVLTRALAINDKGSIVAQLRLASGATSLVRLTAKP